MINSFRQYIQTLEADNDLVRVDDPVSWNMEASAVTMLANQHDEQIPLFETVQDATLPGAQLIGDPYRGSQKRPWDRIARGLGLPGDMSGPEFYETIIERLSDQKAPETVNPTNAPCKEEIHTGEDVNLLDIPWPYIHAGDGGRYSNLHTLVAPDLKSDWTDWSYHRAMIHDKETASVLLLAGEQTPNLFYYDYEARDEPMPAAIAVGVEPAVQYASVMWIPTGRDEAQFAGGLKEAPIELTPCETNDLAVPATAEVIIEGRIIPNARRDEGPFGDYFGYMHGPRRSMPEFKVDAITHREDPIIPFCVEGSGVGYSENTTSSMEVSCVGPDATLGLRAAGFDVECCAPWQPSPRTVYTVATETPHPGYLHEMANFIYTTWGMLHIDCFVFVDPDVNPLDGREVLEAIALYADPDVDFHQFDIDEMPKVPLNIYQTPTEKGDVRTGVSKTTTAKTYIDATRGDLERIPATSGVDRRQSAQAKLERAGMDPSTLPFLNPGENDI
ncbi:UbiD family decarboxylase [Natrialbaceae archaeon A-gly3]